MISSTDQKSTTIKITTHLTLQLNKFGFVTLTIVWTNVDRYINLRMKSTRDYFHWSHG